MFFGWSSFQIHEFFVWIQDQCLLDKPNMISTWVNIVAMFLTDPLADLLN